MNYFMYALVIVIPLCLTLGIGVLLIMSDNDDWWKR